MVQMQAQVGIGTAIPHTSSILDMDVNSLSIKKGFLLPRLNLLNNTDAVTIPNPTVGMTAYNINQSGIGLAQVNQNSIVVWDNSQWQKISSLPEIRFLKQPIEFVSMAFTNQNFTSTSQLATVNANTPVEVIWNPADIQVSNVNDIEMVDNHFKILTSSLYQFSGMVTFRANVAVVDAPSHVTLVLQKSNDQTTWTNFYASSLPFDNKATGKSQSITIPNVIHRLAENEFFRMVIYKPSSANNYTDNSGIIVNVTDDSSKSIRILRIQE